MSNLVLKHRCFSDPENFLYKLLILETLQYDITVQGSALCSKNILLEPNALCMWNLKSPVCVLFCSSFLFLVKFRFPSLPSAKLKHEGPPSTARASPWLLYSQIRCIYILYILGISVPSIILADLLGNTCLLAQVQKVLVCDWWISIRLVYFVFQGLLLCDHPVSGNNRLVKFASQISLIFLILVTCKNKATSASFLWQKIHSLSRFPLLFLSSLELFSAKLGKHITLWFALTLPLLKWLTEQKNPKSLRSLQYVQHGTTNFAFVFFKQNPARGQVGSLRLY